MKRCLLLLTLLLLPGCDVAVAALLFSSNNDSSDDDSAPLTSGKGKRAYVYVGNIADDAAAAIERANLVNLQGNPGANWTELGSLTATDIFDPDASVEPFNAILIQVSSDESFSIDAIEALDANGNVVGHASGVTYASFVQPEASILNAPDGVFSVTSATGSVRAFIFTLWPFQVDRFRINLRASTQAPFPGDILAVGGVGSFPGQSQRPGGMAVDANGIVYLTNSRGDTAHLTLFNVGGLTLPTTTQFGQMGTVQIAADLATAGSHCVAVNSAGKMFTACSITTGIIEVKRFSPSAGLPPNSDPTLDANTTRSFSSTFNGDRVEPNGIALDQTGNVVIVGGFSSLLSGRNHWRVKIPDTVMGSVIWQSSTSLDSSSSTYWHAVTTDGDDTLITGDLFSGSLLGGTNQIYTSLFDTTGVATMDDAYPAGEASPDVGHAIATDASGNIYIGGYATTAANGRNAILVRYDPAFGTARDTTIVGGLDDEILDIAVDTDGSIFAVGYTTTASQGQNWFVRKYRYNTTINAFEIPPVWERTHDGTGGDDQAVSVVITGNNVVVAGFETESAVTVIKMRVYAK